MRRLLILLALLTLPSVASAREGWRDWCWNGAKRVTTSGLNSTTTVQATTASCTVTIYVHGGSTLATIYSDNNNTSLANPFTGSNPNGQFIWYADNGRYDQTINVTINGASNTVTMSDVLLCDPYVTGSTCNNGGSTTAHNLLSTTHLDTIPKSPPTRGDIITAQNQTSPTGVNPSWASLAIGTSGQVVSSNGTDVLWGNIVAGTNISISSTGGNTTINATAGGSGCTLSGIDTGVLSEHPAGTCFDSVKFTWNATKQLMLAHDGSTTATSNVTDSFNLGSFNVLQDAINLYNIGEANSLWGIAGGSLETDYYIFGDGNQIKRSNSGLFAIGEGNRILDVDAGILVLGFGQFVQSTVASSPANISDCVLINSVNFLSLTPGAHTIDSCVLIGTNNHLEVTASGTAVPTDSIMLLGERNQVISTSLGVDDIHVLGDGNTVEDTLALSSQIEMVGEFNDVNGSISTVQIFGFKNIAHNVSAQISGTVNTTIVGSANNVTNTGATGTPAYQGVFGASSTLQNCTGCWIVGQGVTNSTNQLLAIGMSTVPEMAITSGHNAITGHIDQSATKNIAGVCSMAAGTTCTWTLTAAFSGTPVCIVTVQSATLTGGVAGCTVSGTTVTITANSSNSLSWGALLIGNPN